MRELCLLAVLAAAVLLGLLVMRRLDRFLTQNEERQDAQLQTQERLRIGFENPMLAACVTGVLRQCEKKYPDTAVTLCSGTAEQLLEELSGGRIDVAIIAVCGENAVSLPLASRRVPLQHKPLHLAYHGFIIQPVTSGVILQTVVWSKAAETGAMGYFLKCLKGCANRQ